ncbi:MAG: hypothetical protein ACREXZ_07090 [Paraburkholderia sp.]
MKIQTVDVNSLRFHEGTHVVLSDGATLGTSHLFEILMMASMALAGKPVRCAGILPGVTMWATTGALRVLDGEEPELLTADIWSKVRPKLVNWLTMPASPPGITMALGTEIRLEFGWDDRHRVREGAIGIDVAHDSAAVARYAKRRRQAPLADGRPVAARQGATSRRDDLRADIRQRLVQALLRSGDAATDPRLARLPGPVRYRVTGALAAWDAVREAVDRVMSPTLTEILKSNSILSMTRYLDQFTRDLLPHGVDGRPADMMAMVAQYSTIWLAFEARHGVFYEPTPPLHRLLDASYIADDVPIGMVRLPADTLCIIPEPTRWKRAGDIEAIAIFRTEHSLGFATWLSVESATDSAAMDSITLPLDEPDRTIRELVDEVFKAPPSAHRQSATDDVDEREWWRNALNYAIKMLLYLNARDAQVVDDRGYSNAQRHFNGLGKRRRAERLTEIEQLYDRHIVGPAILDMQAARSVPTDGEPHEVRGHYRRPHFRMQPYGPQASLRKLVFIGPTIVRADRLGLQ